jgi:uncharacterized Zn finger protein (UPF0148 family)
MSSVCPECGIPLTLRPSGSLYCPGCWRYYPKDAKKPPVPTP